MSQDSFVKKSIVALTLVFSGVVMSAALSDNDITGVWQSDEVGTIDIQPCESNKAKFCGYLLEVKPDISERFNLHVYKDRKKNLIITGLQARGGSNKLQGGKFSNIDGFLAANATVEVVQDDDGAKVVASIAFFSANFNFERVEPSRLAPKIASSNKTSDPKN